MTSSRFRPVAASLALTLMLSACMVGPNYTKPPVTTPPAFKEAPSAQNGWVPSQPMDTIQRGAWWSAFADPVLDGLEQKVRVSNQNVAQAVAAYDQARALTSADRASLFPTLSATGSATRSGGGPGARSSGQSSTLGTTVGSTAAASGYAVNSYTAALGASWAPDVWGRLRRQLGIAIIGGQVASQELTLLTTPVVYLYMDKLRRPRRRTTLGDRLRGPPPSARL